MDHRQICTKVIFRALEFDKRATEQCNNQTNEKCLWNSVKVKDFVGLAKYLAHGADSQIVMFDEKSMSLLQLALTLDDLPLCEYLLLWVCDLDHQDSQGWSALHYAVDRNQPK